MRTLKLSRSHILSWSFPGIGVIHDLPNSGVPMERLKLLFLSLLRSSISMSHHGAPPAAWHAALTARPDRLGRPRRVRVVSRPTATATLPGRGNGSRVPRLHHPPVRPRLALPTQPPPRPSDPSATLPGKIGQSPRRHGRTSTRTVPGDARGPRQRPRDCRGMALLPRHVPTAAAATRRVRVASRPIGCETAPGGRDGARALRRQRATVRPRSALLAPPPPRPVVPSATPGEIG